MGRTAENEGLFSDVFHNFTSFVGKSSFIILFEQTAEMVVPATATHVALENHVSIKLIRELFVLLFVLIYLNIVCASAKTNPAFENVALRSTVVACLFEVYLFFPFVKRKTLLSYLS